MSQVVNQIRTGFYLDSVALMRISRTVAAFDGVEEAALMMGTPANKQIMRDAGLLAAEGEAASGGDLVLGVRAVDASAADAAISAATDLLAAPKSAEGGNAAWRPRTLRAATALVPEANLALISVPGDFAAAEARKAIRRGLNAMIFSDNVPLEDEVSVKTEARERGLLVMGPDCGTAIIGGVPLAFANMVARGDIGIIGASGTGIQEVTSLISRQGGGISHAIGVGGRDLSEEVGGITTLMAIDALESDPSTRSVVLISKPPSPSVAVRITERIAASTKPFTLCLIGGAAEDLPANARNAISLRNAAHQAMGLSDNASSDATQRARSLSPGRPNVTGLFCGGTLASEAQLIFQAAGEQVSSNAPLPGVPHIGAAGPGHPMIDLGADEYTRGRPHPMIEPAVRNDMLAEALRDPSLGLVLLDLVIGYGAHRDPAGSVAACIAAAKGETPILIASVTGTDGDPQNRAAQVAKLEAAGVLVAPSNADAVELAIACLQANG